MPEPVAPAPSSAPAPASPAPAAAPTPAPAAPASPAPAATPTIENAPSIADAWKMAQDAVPVGVEESAEPVAEPTAEPEAESAAEGETEPSAEPVAEPTAEPTEQPDADLAIPDLVLEESDWNPKEFEGLLRPDIAPELKSRMFAMMRRDNETRGIRQIVPTLELAQEMQRGHQLYSDIDSRFLNATTEEGFKGFMDMWVEQALITDDKGQPIKDENGQYKIHPALTNVIENIHANRNNYLLGEMAKSGKIPPAVADSTLKVIDFLSKSSDERLQEAAAIIKEAISPSSSAQGELPAELQPFSDSLKAKEKELNDREQAANRQRAESEQAARTEALRRADSQAAHVCIGQVKPLLQKAGLTEYEQKAAMAKIGDLIDAKLKATPGYQIARNRLEDGQIDAAREKAISKVVLTYTQEILGEVVAQVIREATGGKLSRQAATDARVADQAAQSRTDPRGASVASSPGAPKTTAEIEAGLIKEYADTHGGAQPDRRWITQEMWKRMASGPARRTA